MPEGARIIGRVAIKVIPDTGDFRKDAKRELAAVEKSLGDIKIGFEADLEEVYSETRDALKKAQREADRNKIKLQLELNSADKKVVQAEIAALGRNRRVLFSPELNQGAAGKVATTLAALSGARGVGNIFSDIGESLQNVDKAIPKISAYALAITNLSSAALAGSANIFSLGGSIASIAPAALALPGIFGGIAIGVGATVAVLKDFNTVLPEVGQRFHDLQDQMSEKFWAKAKKPIRDFIDTLFPEFSRGMNQISGDLGGFFANLASSSGGILNGALQGMFDDLGKSIQIAGTYTDSFVDIIRRLGEVGAGELPRLADYVGKLGEKFDGFLRDKGRSGLEKQIDTGIEALKDFGGVIANTSSILAGLYRAADAAGSSSLQTLNASLGRIADTVNSASFRKKLTGVFEAAHVAIDELVDGAGPEFRSFVDSLADVLTNVLPTAGRTLGTAFGAIFDGLNQPAVIHAAEGLFDSLERSISNLAPAMPAVGRGLAAIANVVGQLAENVTGGLGPALEAVGNSLPGLQTKLAPLIDQLGRTFQLAIKGATPVFQDLVSAVGDLASVTAQVLSPINDLLGAIDKLPGPVKTVLASLAALAALTGGGAWLGAAVAAKATALGNAILSVGTKAGVAEGAFLRTGVAATDMGTRMGGIGRQVGLGAGLALLSLKGQADDVSTSLGDLTGVAGAALAGFAVGGPIGAGVAAAGASFFSLKGYIDGVSDSLKDVDQVIANGNLDQMNARLESLKQQAEDMTHKNDSLTDSFIAQANPLAKAREQYDVLFGHDKVAAEADRLSDAIQHNNDLGNLLGQTIGLTAQQLRDGASAADQMSNSLSALSGWFSKRDAVRSYKDSIDTLSVSLKKGFNRETAGQLDNVGQGIVRVAQAIKNPVQRDTFINKATDQLQTLANTAGPKAQAAIQEVIAKLKQKALTNPDPIKLKGDTSQLDGKLKGAKGDLSIMGRSLTEPKIGANDNPFESIYGTVKQHMREADALRADPKVNLDAGNFFSTVASIAAHLASLHDKTIHITTVTVGGHQSSTVEPHAHVNQRTASSGFVLRKGVIDSYAADVIDEYQKALGKALNKNSSKIQANFDALLSKFDSRGEQKAINNFFGPKQKKYEGLAKAVSAMNNRLEAAQGALQGLLDQQAAYKQSLVDQVAATSDPTQLGAFTYDGIIRGMQSAADQAKKFQTVIDGLIKDGLNKTTLQQILSAGPQAGLATAQAILDGGVAQVNDIQDQLNSAASGVASAASDVMFGSLIDDAQSTVASLFTQLQPLEQGMRDFATTLIDALRDQLQKEALGLFYEVTPDNTDGKGKNKNKGKTTKRAASTAGYSSASVNQKVLNYYAADGRSLAEDDLFSALGKGWV